jgi:hypothetical protein
LFRHRIRLISFSTIHIILQYYPHYLSVLSSIILQYYLCYLPLLSLLSNRVSRILSLDISLIYYYIGDGVTHPHQRPAEPVGPTRRQLRLAVVGQLKNPLQTAENKRPLPRQLHRLTHPLLPTIIRIQPPLLLPNHRLTLGTHPQHRTRITRTQHTQQ